ncbi:hypothetical protein Tco_0276430 [Tanacetum coccineum]
MPQKSAPMTQAAIRRMIKESVDTSARQANVRNNANGSVTVRGQDTALAVRECTFAGFMKCNPTVFRGIKGAVKLQRWFKKTESVFKISECAEGKKVKFDAATLEGTTLTWWKTKVATIEEVQRMEHELWSLKPERVKVDAYIWGLLDNIKGEVTSSKPVDLNEAVHMAHKLMEQKSQARDARILEGKKQKWESYQSGNSSGKGNQKDNSRQTLQNSQKPGNAQSMVTAPTDGKLPFKVILGTDVQRRLSKKKLEKFVAELMLLRMLNLKSSDPPLSRGYILGSGKDSMKLLELMESVLSLYEIVRKRKERNSQCRAKLIRRREDGKEKMGEEANIALIESMVKIHKLRCEADRLLARDSKQREQDDLQ